MFRYRAHGLDLRIDFPVSVLEPDLTSPGDAILIGQGDLPASLEWPEKLRRFYQTTPHATLLRAPEAGRLLVSGGTQILYERAPGATDDSLAAHVLGSGLAAIHHQRGNVILHAASLCRAGRVFLICGASGVGKSTTTAHLLARGGATMGDDVAAIGEAPGFLVYPGPQFTRLTDEALAGLDAYASRASGHRCVAGKRIVPTRQLFAATPQPLGGIIVLETGDSPNVNLTRIAADHGAETLLWHTFRKRFVTRDRMPGLTAKCAILARATPMWRVVRPIARDTIDQVVDKVEWAIADMAR